MAWFEQWKPKSLPLQWHTSSDKATDPDSPTAHKTLWAILIQTTTLGLRNSAVFLAPLRITWWKFKTNCLPGLTGRMGLPCGSIYHPCLSCVASSKISWPLAGLPRLEEASLIQGPLSGQSSQLLCCLWLQWNPHVVPFAIDSAHPLHLTDSFQQN